MDALTKPSVQLLTLDVQQLRDELACAVDHLEARGLHQSAKWAAEQLMGLEDAAEEGEEEGEDVDSERLLDERLQKVEDGDEADRRRKERNTVRLAKSYFNVKEYRRAAHTLEPCKGSRALFLRRYSLYLAGEKRKEEELQELKEHCPIVNVELKQLEKELSAEYNAHTLDPFGQYIYGIVLRERGAPEAARAVLVNSCNGYPWNWAAWRALSRLCHEPEHLHRLAVTLQPHVVRDAFMATALAELQAYDEALVLLKALDQVWGSSRFLTLQAARAHYNKREFTMAEELFEEIRRDDPYGLDGLDIYSNILYVRESAAELSYLAHHAHNVNKYSPETCVIVGNYYSLRGRHKMAVVYFQRAVKLNRRYLYAWTLMGHEFLELKTPEAAINAYRKSVDLNPRDYRGWYMLGHTYEILDMVQYAIYYYQKASAIWSSDSRVWIALGCCCTRLGKQESAIKYFERALQATDRDGLAVKHLAQIYDESGNMQKAAYYYKKQLDRLDEIHGKDSHDPDQIEALKKLGAYCQATGETVEAVEFYERLLSCPGTPKDFAKRQLKAIYMEV